MARQQVARVLTLILLVFCQGCRSQEPQCGMAVNNNRIVGGQDADPGSWPWQVAMFIFGFFTCGGSLINSQWVLTAAHCLRADLLNDTTIVLGLHNRTNAGPDSMTISIEQIVCHPEYDSVTFENDICLLKLSKSVTFSESIQPVCLASIDSTIHAGVSSYVTGFGATFESPLADVLQEVKVPIVGNNECSCNYGDTDIIITERMICAAKENGGMDSCQGDSGGPLTINDSPVWIQFGIVSFGIGCGRPGRPGVYTRVSKYEDWIKMHVDGPEVGFVTFNSPGEDSDSSFVCPTRPPSEFTTGDDSIFGSGENLAHFAHFFFLCVAGLSLQLLVGGNVM